MIIVDSDTGRVWIYRTMYMLCLNEVVILVLTKLLIG